MGSPTGGNRIRLTTGRDPYRSGDGGSRAQPGSKANVAGLDQARRRIVASIDEQLSALERDLEQGRHERLPQALPAIIALVEQVQGLAGHKQRQTRINNLIRSRF